MAQYVGRVVGTKMPKTAKVAVTRLMLHPVIKKYWNDTKVYFAHDENNDCRDGDLVMIKECRKLSKRKYFRLLEIIERAPTLDDFPDKNNRTEPASQAIKEEK